MEIDAGHQDDGRIRDATYLHGLSHGLHLPSRLALRIAAAHPLPCCRPTDAEAVLIRDRAIEATPRRRAPASTDWWSEAERVIAAHVDAGFVPLPFTDDNYPPLLRGIPDPPIVLFARGNLAALRSPDAVAVVGTRESTSSGNAAAREIARHLVSQGYTIVAGLALGIDTAAHEAALEAGGRTVAVLPSGLDRIYPPENIGLAGKIAASGGCLITEYPLGFDPRDWTFVQRDRIESGMSVAVIPIQTGLTGGTMRTIEFAEKQGRLLLCPEPRTGEDGGEWAGIRELLRSGRAKPLVGEWRVEMRGLLPEARERLLATMTAAADDATRK